MNHKALRPALDLLAAGLIGAACLWFCRGCATIPRNNPSTVQPPAVIPKQDRYERTVTSFDASKGPPMPDAPARAIVANVITHTNAPFTHLTFTLTNKQPEWAGNVLQCSTNGGRTWQDVCPWTNYPLVLARSNFVSGSWFRNVSR